MTLKAAVAAWITRKEINCAASTISGYRRLLRLYIDGTRPGDREIDEIDESDVIELLKPLIRRGCTRQAQLLQILVVAVVRDCVRRRVLAYNPMDCMERVKHTGKMTAWLTEEQAKIFLQKAKENEDPFFIAWLLMLCCGLRRGEMLGLRWTDIDFDRAELHIVRQRIRVDGQVMFTQPKSAASVRHVPLSDHLLSILMLKRPAEAVAGEIVTVSEHVFASALDRALTAAELPRVTLHGLRHTFASVAGAEDVPIITLQGLMGHAHYAVTADIYTHVTDEPRRRAAETISAALIGARLEIA